MRIKITGLSKESYDRVIQEFPNGHHKLCGDFVYWIFSLDLKGKRK